MGSFSPCALSVPASATPATCSARANSWASFEMVAFAYSPRKPDHPRPDARERMAASADPADHCVPLADEPRSRSTGRVQAFPGARAMCAVSHFGERSASCRQTIRPRLVARLSCTANVARPPAFARALKELRTSSKMAERPSPIGFAGSGA